MTKYLLILAGSVLVATTSALIPTLAQAQSSSPTFIATQPDGEMLGRLFIGSPVKNAAGETVGDVNDVVFSRAGQISTIVLGVGGFLGMGEKNVAVPFNSVKVESGKDGARVLTVLLSKEVLKDAAAFKSTEKSTYDIVKDKATEMGMKASEKAGELTGQGAKKVEGTSK
jgi:sporulation protein YlmC with PRC-barrel domain